MQPSAPKSAPPITKPATKSPGPPRFLQIAFEKFYIVRFYLLQETELISPESTYLSGKNNILLIFSRNIDTPLLIYAFLSEKGVGIFSPQCASQSRIECICPYI